MVKTRAWSVLVTPADLGLVSMVWWNEKVCGGGGRLNALVLGTFAVLERISSVPISHPSFPPLAFGLMIVVAIGDLYYRGLFNNPYSSVQHLLDLHGLSDGSDSDSNGSNGFGLANSSSSSRQRASPPGISSSGLDGVAGWKASLCFFCETHPAAGHNGYRWWALCTTYSVPRFRSH